MLPGKYVVKKKCSEVIYWYETAEIVAYNEDDAIAIARRDLRDEDGDRPDWSDRRDEDWGGYDADYELERTIYEPEEEEEESAELVKPAGVLTVFLEGVEL